MRKLAFLSVAFALVAVSFYGCDETSPTEPHSSAEAVATGPSFDKHPVKTDGSCLDGQVLRWSDGDEGWQCYTLYRPSRKLDVLASMPYFSANFWQVIAANPTNSSRELQVYALCA